MEKLPGKLDMDVGRTINVGRIKYMNDAPVYYGLDTEPLPAWLKLVSGPPAMLNRRLKEGTLDISPISSVAFALHQDDWLLLPDISISCFGSVMSVLLVSHRPLEALNGQRILLTDESATGVALLKLLFAWKNIEPMFQTGRIADLSARDTQFQGALVIGDAALTGEWGEKFAYLWDLGEMWRTLTGLPFVFALWAVRKTFAQANAEAVMEVMALFKASKKKGAAQIDHIAEWAAGQLKLDVNLIRNYYNLLRFDLGALQIEGLNAFFDGLYKEKIIGSRVRLDFFMPLKH